MFWLDLAKMLRNKDSEHVSSCMFEHENLEHHAEASNSAHQMCSSCSITIYGSHTRANDASPKTSRLPPVEEEEMQWDIEEKSIRNVAKTRNRDCCDVPPCPEIHMGQENTVDGDGTEKMSLLLQTHSVLVLQITGMEMINLIFTSGL